MGLIFDGDAWICDTFAMMLGWKKLFKNTDSPIVVVQAGDLRLMTRKTRTLKNKCTSRWMEHLEKNIWVFPKIVENPQNGWFISWKTLLKWMIWGYPYLWKHPYTQQQSRHHLFCFWKSFSESRSNWESFPIFGGTYSETWICSFNFWG